MLRGVKIVSLALNLPGPAALMRCKAMGATCVKLEPPAGDPMRLYSPEAYAALHQGVRVLGADLKTAQGQAKLAKELTKADIFLTSFRPSALKRLGLDWQSLHKQFPQLSQVAIVGGEGVAAEVAGHDLTYLAENDLITGLDLPPTLYADMGGSLMAVEAVLAATIKGQKTGVGIFQSVALSKAAQYLALPRSWGLTKREGAVGGAHAGYQIYKCKDGRAVVAALEPHFAARLCALAGIENVTMDLMMQVGTKDKLKDWFSRQTQVKLKELASLHDLPIHTLAV